MASSARTRAQQRTTTREAPPRLSSRAQASPVAPLVWTSSTSSTVFSASRARASGASANAPATTFARARRPSPCNLGVAFTRRSRSVSTRSPCRLATARAISTAWLNPRDQSRQRCSGTGTNRSAPSGTSRAIARAIVSATASRPPYLSLSARCRATSPYATAARTPSCGGGRARQSPHCAPSPRSYSNGRWQVAHHGGPRKCRLSQQLAQKR